MVIHWPQGHQGHGRDPAPVPPLHRHRRRPSSTSSASRCRRPTAASSSTRSTVSRCATPSTRRRTAPTEKKAQYYAMLGTRGIWKDGWKAVGHPRPDQRQGPLRPGRVGALPRRRGPLRVERPRGRAAREAAGDDRRLVRARPRQLRAAARRPHARSSWSTSSVPRPSRCATATSTTPARRPCPRASRSASAAARTRSSPTSMLDADAAGRAVRARVPLRRARAVHQGPQAALRLQLPRHPAGADLHLRAS